MESQQETNKASEETSIVQERLNWKLAWRDDAKVAQGLSAVGVYLLGFSSLVKRFEKISY